MYAFSTENWSRPKQEVNYLMDLPEKMFSNFMPELIKNNVQVKVIGNISELPSNTQNAINKAIEEAKNNTGLKLIFALNYGSKLEILNAVKNIVEDYKNNIITLDKINDEKFSNYLSTKDYPNPDLLIRMPGEQRISNFLLLADSI